MITFDKLQQVCKYHISDKCCYALEEYDSDMIVNYCREDECLAIKDSWGE